MEFPFAEWPGKRPPDKEIAVPPVASTSYAIIETTSGQTATDWSLAVSMQFEGTIHAVRSLTIKEGFPHDGT